MKPYLQKEVYYWDARRTGAEVNLRTSKWNSLHLIFIFLNDGEMMPIFMQVVLQKNGKLTSSVCFVNIYMDAGFYLEKSYTILLSGVLLLIYIFECK